MKRNSSTLRTGRHVSTGVSPQQHPSEPPAPLPTFTVVELTPSNKPGNLKAFVAVKIGKYLVIRGWRVVQQGNQVAWVSVPMQERTQKDGKLKFFPILDLPESWNKAVTTTVLETWDTYQRNGALPGTKIFRSEGAA